MKLLLVVIGAAVSGIIATLLAKELGFQQSAMIGGAVGGACGALVVVKLNNKSKVQIG